jgi:hypothetical protein
MIDDLGMMNFKNGQRHLGIDKSLTLTAVWQARIRW